MQIWQFCLLHLPSAQALIAVNMETIQTALSTLQQEVQDLRSCTTHLQADASSTKNRLTDLEVHQELETRSEIRITKRKTVDFPDIVTDYEDMVLGLFKTLTGLSVERDPLVSVFPIAHIIIVKFKENSPNSPLNKILRSPRSKMNEIGIWCDATQPKHHFKVFQEAKAQQKSGHLYKVRVDLWSRVTQIMKTPKSPWILVRDPLDLPIPTPYPPTIAKPRPFPKKLLNLATPLSRTNVPPPVTASPASQAATKLTQLAVATGVTNPGIIDVEPNVE
jgi:hypothetical protein